MKIHVPMVPGLPVFHLLYCKQPSHLPAAGGGRVWNPSATSFSVSRDRLMKELAAFGLTNSHRLSPASKPDQSFPLDTLFATGQLVKCHV